LSNFFMQHPIKILFEMFEIIADAPGNPVARSQKFDAADQIGTFLIPNNRIRFPQKIPDRVGKALPVFREKGKSALDDCPFF
jgi:hypothetical protein